MQSTRFSLDLVDLGKGVLVAFITAFVTAITVWLNAGAFPTGEQLKGAALTGAAAAAAYLIKNFFTDSVKSAENTLNKAAAKEVAKKTDTPLIP